MATIGSSVVAQASPQIDGTTWVDEVHTDSFGHAWNRSWSCPFGTAATSLLAVHAADVLAQLVAGEIAQNLAAVSTLGMNSVPTFVYSTVAQNAAAVRIFYANATQDQAAFVGEYLNALTDVQLQNAFSLTAGQVTTLRTNKLQPAATLAASIRATTGA